MLNNYIFLRCSPEDLLDAILIESKQNLEISNMGILLPRL